MKEIAELQNSGDAAGSEKIEIEIPEPVTQPEKKAETAPEPERAVDTAQVVIKRCLQIAGCMDTTFFEVEDGYIALDLAKKHDTDLIVTDYNMANMDGMALLKRLKASPRLHDIAVVVVTSSKNDAMVKYCWSWEPSRSSANRYLPQFFPI